MGTQITRAVQAREPVGGGDLVCGVGAVVPGCRGGRRAGLWTTGHHLGGERRAGLHRCRKNPQRSGKVQVVEPDHALDAASDTAREEGGGRAGVGAPPAGGLIASESDREGMRQLPRGGAHRDAQMVGRDRPRVQALRSKARFERSYGAVGGPELRRELAGSQVVMVYRRTRRRHLAGESGQASRITGLEHHVDVKLGRGRHVPNGSGTVGHEGSRANPCRWHSLSPCRGRRGQPSCAGQRCGRSHRGGCHACARKRGNYGHRAKETTSPRELGQSRLHRRCSPWFFRWEYGPH